MSKIPYRFLPIPTFLIDKGWTDDPKTWKLIRCLFKRTRTVGHIEYPNGRELYLEPFEFIFGRKTVAIETGMSEGEVKDRMEKLATSKITSNIPSKSTSKYTVHRWMIECFEENWHQQNNQQNNQQNTGKSTSIAPAEAPAKAPQRRSVEAKREDIQETYSFVSAGASATSFFEQASSPLTSFPKTLLPNYIAEGLEASRSIGFHKVIQGFVFSDGSSVHPKALQRWISWYTEETVVIAMIFMHEKERRAKAKARSITKPEAYMEKILRDCLWEKEEIQNQAKIIDLEQEKKHKGR